MISDVVELYRLLHREVPDATVDEMTAVIRANPGGTINQLALAIFAARPSDDDEPADDGLRAARLAWRSRP